MKRTRNIVIGIIIWIIVLLIFCLGIEADAGKRGVAGPGGCPDIPELPLLYNVLGVDWAYTWHHCGEWFMPSVEYVPMVRSIHTGFNAEDVLDIVTWHGAGGYWLVGNEPGNQWQDNLTPMEAAIAYGEIIDIILINDPAARIILGNFTDPSQWFRETWFNQFKTAWITLWNEDVTTNIVGYGVHAYAHPYASETQQNAIDRVQRQLLAWMDMAPDCELWVTEYGNLQETDVETMRQMTIWLDANVDRYAYFYFGDPSGEWDFTALYAEPWPLPMLTELGEAFINVPIAMATYAPTVTPVMTATPTIIIPPTNTCTPSTYPTDVSTLTPTLAISLTPSVTLTPSATLMPTAIIIPTPPPNPPMPDTLLGVAQEELRVMWRLEKVIYLLAVVIVGTSATLIKISIGEKNEE